jgi:putative endopeptidase
VIRQISVLYFILLLSVACNRKNDVVKQDVVATNLDTTVDPSNDFFMYANGGWIKKIQSQVTRAVGH